MKHFVESVHLHNCTVIIIDHIDSSWIFRSADIKRSVTLIDTLIILFKFSLFQKDFFHCMTHLNWHIFGHIWQFFCFAADAFFYIKRTNWWESWWGSVAGVWVCVCLCVCVCVCVCERARCTLRKASFCSRCLLMRGLTWSVSAVEPNLSWPPHQSSSLLYSSSRLSNTLHTCDRHTVRYTQQHHKA